MAKQNVTFIERHLEKIVVGVCGAVFLGTCAFYLVRSPNRVEVDGESLGPTEFYAQFKAKGEQALNKMKSARFVRPDPDPTIKIVENLKRVNPNLPDQLQIAFVVPNPPVPKITSSTLKQVDLARILPPSKPQGSPGRSAAKLPDQVIISAENINAPPIGEPASAKDTHWIALAATINRKAQREQFEAARYAQERMGLRIGGIEAKRQMLLPSGEWGPDEKVEAFCPVVMPPVVNVVDQGGGEVAIAPEQMTALDSFYKKLETYEQQEALLRPAFQAALLRGGGDWWEWVIPRKLEGLELDLAEDYRVVYRDEVLPKGSGVRRPGPGAGPQQPPRPPVRGAAPLPGAGEGPFNASPIGAAPVAPKAAAPAAGAGDLEANRIARENMAKADKAIAEQNYIAAEKFLQAVLAQGTAQEFQRTNAQKRLDEIKDLFEAAVKELEEHRKQMLEQMRLNFGPNVDPVWVTDISVSPGKTYRYSIRLLAMNRYAGLPSNLNNPQDAAKVMLPGEWSDWSDPVTAKPDEKLYVYKLGDDDKSVQIEIHRWNDGKWRSGGGKVSIAEPIIAKLHRGILSYDGTVTAIERNRPYRVRLSKKDGSIEYRDAPPTEAVAVVNSKGEAQEHLIAEDLDRKKQFAAQILEEKKDREALEKLQPTIETPRTMVPMETNTGTPAGPGGLPQLPFGEPGGR